MRRPTRNLLIMLALAGGAHAEPAGVPRLLLDAQLRTTRVTLRAIDARTITYADERGLVRTEPFADYLAILDPAPAASRTAPAPKPPPPEPAGDDAEGTPPAAPAPAEPAAHASVEIELVDRQRLVGVLRPSVGETITLRHPQLGDLTMPLDRARVVRVNPDASVDDPPGDPAGDAVLLGNGDRLTGVVESIAQTLRLETAGSTREIPLERVSRVVLASTPTQRQGLLVWLADGSVVACEEVRTTRLGEVELRPTLAPAGTAPEPIRLEDVTAVAFRAESLWALAQSPPVAVRPAEGRRWAPPPRVGGRAPLDVADVELAGPGTFEWDVPEGATRFATSLELPRGARTWGQARVRVLGDGKELASCALTGDRPQASVGVALAHVSRLSIVVESGELGPVQNRATLRGAMFLVEHQ